MDQDATWYGGRPYPRPHCIRWGPAPTPQKGHSSPCLLWPKRRCIRILLGMEVDLGPGDIVLDGDPAFSKERGTAAHAETFRPMSIVAKWSPVSAAAEFLLFCVLISHSPPDRVAISAGVSTRDNESQSQISWPQVNWLKTKIQTTNTSFPGLPRACGRSQC